jgi:Amt family ammonium transporter
VGLNGVLAGLVSITANCQLAEPWQAIVIGFVASILLFLGHFLLKYLRMDDPCDATVVHGICGIWGLWAAGIFCLDANVQYAAYPNTNNACKTGQQFGVQVVGSLAIFAWTIGISTFMFLCIKFTVGVRISSDAEVEHLYSYFTLTLLIHLCASLALLCNEQVEHLYSFLLFLYSYF